MARADQTYTDPALRARLKEQIQAGDRGGRPGQWSARKAQLLVRTYEREGGGYVDEGHRTATQSHLEQWGEQDWHTEDGSGDARDGGATSRYLPDVSWKLLSEQERKATGRPKEQADEQFVANTDAAKEARKAAELLTMKATEARRAVSAMRGRSQLQRARTAEAEHGKGRKTVLAAIDAKLS